MAGYAKVFSSITLSSIWCKDHKVLRVWIALLTSCDSNGVMEGSIPGLANLCRISDEEMKEVLDLLMSPDPDSRTPDNEGRRIAAVPGGWKVLNYHLYREKGQGKDGSRAPYMRAYRQKGAKVLSALTPPPEEPEEDSGAPAKVPAPSPEPLGCCYALQTPVTSDTEAEYRSSTNTPLPPQAGEVPARKSKVDLAPLRQQVLEHWRTVAVPAGLPAVLKESDKLRKALDARLKDPTWLGIFREAVTFAARHPGADWMRGGGARGWKCTLGWFLQPDKAEDTAARARASPGRSGGMAADSTTQAQIQQLPPRRILSLAPGAP